MVAVHGKKVVLISFSYSLHDAKISKKILTHKIPITPAFVYPPINAWEFIFNMLLERGEYWSVKNTMLSI